MIRSLLSINSPYLHLLWLSSSPLSFLLMFTRLVWDMFGDSLVVKSYYFCIIFCPWDCLGFRYLFFVRCVWFWFSSFFPSLFHFLSVSLSPFLFASPSPVLYSASLRLLLCLFLFLSPSVSLSVSLSVSFYVFLSFLFRCLSVSLSVSFSSSSSVSLSFFIYFSVSLFLPVSLFSFLIVAAFSYFLILEHLLLVLILLPSLSHHSPFSVFLTS